MSRTASADASNGRAGGAARQAGRPATLDRPATGERSGWTFLTNHLHVLLCITRDPTIRLRDVAAQVGITERATQSIVADLVSAGYLARVKVGRRNQYQVNGAVPLRHPLEQHHSVSSLLEVLTLPPAETKPARSTRRTG
jgi:predicted DNA-binding transcriptional regulator